MTEKEDYEFAARAAGMVDYNPETGSMVWLKSLYSDIKDAILASKKFRSENGFTETHGRAAVEIGRAMP